jgi:RNA polymerase sigma-70 factor (ECF subfamily)
LLHPDAVADKQTLEDRATATFRQHRQSVYRYLRRRTSDHYEAEELTQRVFVDAAVALSKDDFQPDSMLAWLYTVAERRRVDELRRRSNAAETVRQFAQLGGSRPPHYGTAVAETLRSAIAGLPVDQRSVVVMKLLEGRTFAEIASVMGATEGACKMRLSRALKALRARLDEEDLPR